MFLDDKSALNKAKSIAQAFRTVGLCLYLHATGAVHMVSNTQREILLCSTTRSQTGRTVLYGFALARVVPNHRYSSNASHNDHNRYSSLKGNQVLRRRMPHVCSSPLKHPENAWFSDSVFYMEALVGLFLLYISFYRVVFTECAVNSIQRTVTFCLVISRP